MRVLCSAKEKLGSTPVPLSQIEVICLAPLGVRLGSPAVSLRLASLASEKLSLQPFALRSLFLETYFLVQDLAALASFICSNPYSHVCPNILLLLRRAAWVTL
jgi:hypothetical protein